MRGSEWVDPPVPHYRLDARSIVVNEQMKGTNAEASMLKERGGYCPAVYITTGKTARLVTKGWHIACMLNLQ